ncbi:putative type IX secretion system sortase PorU2 [Niabella drilacis]|uniref:CARDB protein n=1 Tax=Niabella drilacis (strain DSM 25811 / CCM 8410 / CCUG 62505 / LMG 26954 / E90) TaxID=1285928 RepID=A0A1G6U509_NIADE|nr:C25 family cysteine peptidase [Niabella drilacis]SDD36512.1 CARDB protein [Niabella drilacis]
MKKLLTIGLLIFSIAAGAQQFGNEWIDYSKTYYKFKIAANGLYRIPAATLAAANLGTVDAAHFQLWRNGVEVPLYTSSGSGALGAGGYIEFWGQMNDGKVDNALYRLPEQQLSDAKSLFTDSSAYFLTVNPAGGNKRLSIVSANIPAGATPEPYFIYRADTSFSEQIHLGRPEGSGTGILYVASIEEGEGWASADISEGQSRSFQRNLYAYTGTGAPDATVQMNVAGNNAATRKAQLTVNGNLVFDQPLVNFDYAKLSRTMPAGMLTGGAEGFVITNAATVSSRMRVASVGVTYARKFDFGGAANFAFTLPARSSGYYLEISNFNFSGGAPVLYDKANGRRYAVDATNPLLLKVFLPAAGQTQDLVLVSQAAANIRQVSALESRTFVNYSTAQNQGNYLMITNSALLSGGDGSRPVDDYRDYRASAAGGGYNAKIYLVDQLTDQFAYGIQYHPLLVRNFLRFARSKFSQQPGQAFLIGKGVSYVSSRVYPTNELAPQLAQLNLVPTFGYPASDVLLAAEGSSSQPLTPIGRLSVVNGNEISVYLEKIKQYEQHLASTPPGIDESAWKKAVIHIVGASDQSTQDLLGSLLGLHQKIIEDTLSGMNVENIIPSTVNQGQQLTERLANRINNGASLLTYFGHSSATTLGFNMEDPASYSNSGKYPVFNMMGCNVGDIFGYSTSRLSTLETVSEKYVLAKDRGSIGMMAGTSLGYISTLDIYNTRFYTLLAQKDYGKTLGELMVHAIAEVYKRPSGENDFLQRAQCEEYTLNGDPAIRLYQFDKPDYAVEDASVSIAPSFISVAETNFTVKARINNLGKAINKAVIVELRRTLPDGSSSVFKRDTLSPIHFADSLQYTIPIDPVKHKGQNKITISIDPENTIAELNKGNNVIVKDVYIYQDEIRPVYPYDYAIVNKQNIVFAASTADPFAQAKQYIMELDTTRLFNSPAKIILNKTIVGGLVEFQPSVTFQNDMVYYWRVADTPPANEEPHWNYASFIYTNGTQEGASQSHYHQLLESDFSGIQLAADRRYYFDSTLSSIGVNTGMYPANGQTTAWQLTVADVITQRGLLSPVQGETIRFYVVNNRNMKVIENEDLGSSGRYGSRRPIGVNGTVTPTFFEFDLTTINGRNSAMNFVDSIPAEYYIVLANSSVESNSLPGIWMGDTLFNGAGKSLYHKLKALGFAHIDEINKTSKYVFFFQNKTGKVIGEAFSQQPGEIVSQTVRVKTLNASGVISSPIFGPAKKWQSLIWEGTSQDSPNSDNVKLEVVGIDKDGKGVSLMNDIAPVKSVVDISAIDARLYPGLRFILHISDTVNYTPYQLKDLKVYYTPVPEGTIAPGLYFSAKDTLDPGEPLNLGIAFKNVSNSAFDSVNVKLSIRNQNNIETVIPVLKQKQLLAGDTIKLIVPLDTKKFLGKNTVFLEFNPNNAPLEQYHFNNFFYKDIYVRSDSVNPYIDVTFDGTHILNKDIVSAKPDILVKLTDDAKWLLLDNPDLIKVQLIDKTRDITYNYKVGTDTLRFTPAGQSDGNMAMMNFKPHMDDGDYELAIAAKDKSGNASGQVQYRVGFQVINKPMISNMLNYPNPFTTATAFVFTLTGSEVPQNIRIQILTITGKIVREITQAELGPLRIGRNITEFRWDGTDQYGQKVANGVYLYRVITNLNGKSLEKYKAKDDNTDKYFNKGYGKMYFMR